jgi:hypothetical protein
MTRRAARSLVVGTITCLALAGSRSPAEAATYGATQAAASTASWNPGKALAATDRLLLSAWASDCPPPKGICARDTKPKMGVYVQRSPVEARPAAWRKPVRVSQGKKQAERASLAADGSLAAVGWVTQTSYLHYRPSARRVFWVRVSSDHGMSWRKPHSLSATFGRVDYPRIAVSEGTIYAAWTNAATGEIRLAVSANAGVTWTKRTIGTSTAHADGGAEGFAALPDVGASGQNVVVVWFADGGGAVTAAGSTNGGANWSTTPLTTSSANVGLTYAAAQGATDGASHRVAIAYGTDAGIDVRTFDGGGLNGARTLADWPEAAGGSTFTDGYGPAIAPYGNSGLVAAYAGCRAVGGSDPCDTASASKRIDVLVTSSGDDGQDWSTPVRLTNATSGPYRINDEPSIALAGGIQRIAFDRYQVSFANYRVGMRSGS